VDRIETLHHRYAKALFSIAEAKGKEDEVMDNLKFLAGLMRDDKRVSGFVYNPQIKGEEKLKLFISIGEKEKFCDEFIDFLKLIIRKRRLKLIYGILPRYRDIYNAHKNRIVVLVKSAYELEKTQMDRLKDALARRFKKEVLIKQTIEPSLIGGFLLKFGDRVYDASLKTGLLKLKEVVTL